MEEMMMVMMKIRSHEPSANTHHPNIPSITCPSWKLYENPFYIPHQKSQQNHHHPENHQQHSDDQKQIHRLHLPISTRKIAASFWDLKFIKPFMESELEMATAEITLLKAELEFERKACKKIESLNERLAGDLTEERKGREALERVCEELAKEISSDKAEIRRMKKEMQEERKMLRMAEVIREERVQMKLAEAKILLEERFSELEMAKKVGTESSSNAGKKEAHILYQEDNADHSMAVMERRVSAEFENPHIRRGIKGIVEFPKVVRAVGCRSKQLGRKLECQKTH